MNNAIRKLGHVVIIGAGLSGGLIAARLAMDGWKNITIVEAANKDGDGSTDRSAACARGQWGTRHNVIAMRYALWSYDHIGEQLGIPQEEFYPVLTKNGYLFLYENPELCPPWEKSKKEALAQRWDAAQAAAKMQQELRLPVEILTADEISTRFPHLAEESWRLIGGTWCAEDGFLQPDLIRNYGLRRARELGAVVRTNTTVIGSTIKRGRITGVRVKTVRPDGQEIEETIACDWVVNATNAWAPRVSAALGGSPLAIAPMKRYLAFTPRPPNFDEATWRQLPMTIYGMGKGRGCYSRPDGGLMIGCSHETEAEPNFRHEDQDRIEDGFNDASWGEPYSELMRQQVEQFAPSLVKGQTVSHMTCGYYGMTPDAHPFIGLDPKIRNLVQACGFSGHGAMFGPVTALIVSAILNHRVRYGRVSLPKPFRGQHLDIRHFAVGRSFDHAESAVI